MEIKKFKINEDIARTAKEINSFSDYKENEATNGYNNYLKRFDENVERLKAKAKNKITPEIEQTIEYYCNRYSYKLAEAINKENSIEARCPSIMISGAGNFNVRAKQKQNSARDSFWQKYGDLYNDNNYYTKKIENLLFNTTVYSNDELAIEKLENKIEELEKSQAIMKEANAYYRKHKTMVGFDILTEEDAKAMDRGIENSWYKVPYASFELTNNNANIKRNKERLEELKKLKQRAENTSENKYQQIEGLKVEEDANDMRIRILFDYIPDVKTRDLLKHWGFKWSPKNSAWQRQLTANGIWATKQVLKALGENYLKI